MNKVAGWVYAWIASIALLSIAAAVTVAVSTFVFAYPISIAVFAVLLIVGVLASWLHEGWAK